jgi:hypothetical protein
VYAGEKVFSFCVVRGVYAVWYEAHPDLANDMTEKQLEEAAAKLETDLKAAEEAERQKEEKKAAAAKAKEEAAKAKEDAVRCIAFGRLIDRSID